MRDNEKLIAELEAIHSGNLDNFDKLRLATQAATALREADAELKQLRAENKVNYDNAVTVSDMFVKQGLELSALRAEIDAYKNCHETAPSLLRDNFAFAEEVDKLRAELAIVTEHLNRDCEDAGVAIFQAEVKAALEEGKSDTN